MNDKFLKFHGPTSFRRKSKVVKTLSDVISKEFPHVPFSVIKRFVRLRTIIRIRHINEKEKKMKVSRKWRRYWMV